VGYARWAHGALMGAVSGDADLRSARLKIAPLTKL
jgi:hypothetical protein